jgi:hypothetical protein
MEVRTNFSTFKPGDVVRIKRDFPYINQQLMIDEIYTIDQMFADAGIVSLVGQDKNKTFPEDAFELLHNGEMSVKE